MKGSWRLIMVHKNVCKFFCPNSIKLVKSILSSAQTEWGTREEVTHLESQTKQFGSRKWDECARMFPH